jgi:hypothetical protein
MDNSYEILLSQSSKRSKQMTRNEAKALWISSFAAFAKLNRNIAKAQFADMQRKGSQFSDFETLLSRLRSKAQKANKAAIAATTDVSIITEAEAEWRKAA